MGGETEGLIFVIFVVWSALIFSRWLMVAWGKKSSFGLTEISRMRRRVSLVEEEML